MWLADTLPSLVCLLKKGCLVQPPVVLRAISWSGKDAVWVLNAVTYVHPPSHSKALPVRNAINRDRAVFPHSGQGNGGRPVRAVS